MSGARHIGPLAVCLTGAEIDGFAMAVMPADAAPPSATSAAILPIRLLARPEVRAALAELIDLSRFVPVHEAQSFDFPGAPLRPGTRYALSVELSADPDAEPPRLALSARVRAPDGTEAVAMLTRLRVVPLRGQ